jgi:hypothetical protein
MVDSLVEQDSFCATFAELGINHAQDPKKRFFVTSLPERCTDVYSAKNIKRVRVYVETNKQNKKQTSMPWHHGAILD